MKSGARPASASSVKTMQQQSKSLILIDPAAVIASCRNLCNPRRLVKRLPLITASVASSLLESINSETSRSSRKTRLQTIQERRDRAVSAIEQQTIQSTLSFTFFVAGAGRGARLREETRGWNEERNGGNQNGKCGDTFRK